MSSHNIVVFGGDHCGPEVCLFAACERIAGVENTGLRIGLRHDREL